MLAVPGQVGEQVAEGERPRRRGRLHDVQALPAQVRAHLERVPALQPREGIGNLRDAGAEVRRRARRRSELLIPPDEKRRDRVRKPCARWNAGKAQARRRGAVQLSGRSSDRPPGVADAQLVQQAARKRPLVAGRERPGRRVLRAERARRHAAALGERRHRREVFLETGQAPEHVIAVGRDTMVETKTELILIDRFVVHAPVVVGRPGGRRQRIAFQERPSDRIHPFHGNRVAREGTTGRAARSAWHGGGRIVDGGNASADGFGEDALTLEQRRNGGDHRASDGLPLALIVREKERAVPANGTSDHATELIATELRLDRRGRRKEIARIQRFVPEELEHAAAKRVAAGFGRQIDDAAVEASELRGRTIGLDLELLDRVDVREEGDLSGLGLQDGDAVEQVFVRARPSAVDARQRRRRCRGQRHSWHQARERHEAPPVERQIDDLPVVDDVAESRRRAAEERRVGRDGDGVGQAAELQLQIEAHGLAGRETDALPGQRPEAGQLDAHQIGSGRQPLDDETAGLARDGRPRQAGAHGDHRNGRASHRSARRVHDITGQRGSANLGPGRHGAHRRQPQPHACHTPASDHRRPR